MIKFIKSGFTPFIRKLFHTTKVAVESNVKSFLDKLKIFSKVEYLTFMCIVVTTVTTIVTSLVAYMQWNAMQEQLTEMKLTRKYEQRPFLTHSIQDEVVEPNKKISFNITTANYGKSPAMGIMKAAHVFYGKNALLDAGKCFESYGDKPINLFGDSIIPPTSGNSFSYITAESEMVFSIKEYDEFKNGAYPIIVAVKEFYSDVSGNGYSSETEIRWLPNNALQVIRNSTNNLYEK